MVLFANDPIRLGRLIHLVRHLEHQDVARSLVTILATKQLVAPLANDHIMSKIDTVLLDT